jgi:hypothetical protein
MRIKEHFSRRRRFRHPFSPFLVLIGLTTAAHAAPQLPSPPLISTSFSPTLVSRFAASQLTVTLTNPNNAAMYGVHFEDVYPAGMVNSPSMLIVNACGGSIDAQPNGTWLVTSGVVLPAKATCSVSIAVDLSVNGTVTNHTGLVGATNAPSGNEAVAALAVDASSLVPSPAAGVQFNPDVVTKGTLTELDLMITDTPPLWANHTGLQFVHRYPPGLQNANSNVVVSNNCGGTVVAPPGDNFVALANGSLPSLAICYVRVRVITTSAGVITDTFGPVLSSNALLSNVASNSLTVNP